jgi:hypothetical protein
MALRWNVYRCDEHGLFISQRDHHKCLLLRCECHCVGVADFDEASDTWGVIDDGSVDAEDRKAVVASLVEPMTRQQYRMEVRRLSKERLEGMKAMLGYNKRHGTIGPILASEIMRGGVEE